VNYLLDTNVVSEIRKMSVSRSGPARIDKRVKTWFESVSPYSLYVSVITVLELEIGFLRLERRDPVQGAAIRAWVRDFFLPSFASRILDVDLAIAQHSAALHVPDPQDDRDALIAATALVHGMTVVTRNAEHFRRTGVAVFDPWQA
jgi:predicted nucleic acid-binding protein